MIMRKSEEPNLSTLSLILVLILEWELKTKNDIQQLVMARKKGKHRETKDNVLCELD